LADRLSVRAPLTVATMLIESTPKRNSTCIKL
jgi:hypothetical protein